MASSMTTEANGVRVVTHIIPLEEKTESPDLKSSSDELEKSNLSPKNKMFLKGKPLSLGVRAGHSFTSNIKYNLSFVDSMLTTENNLGLFLAFNIL